MSCCCQDNIPDPYCAYGNKYWVNSPYPTALTSASWHPRLMTFLGANNNVDAWAADQTISLCYGDINQNSKNGYGAVACAYSSMFYPRGIAIPHWDGDSCKQVDWDNMTYTEFQLRVFSRKDEEGNKICGLEGRARTFSYASGVPSPWPSEELMPFQVVHSSSDTEPPSCSLVVVLPFNFGPAGTVEVILNECTAGPGGSSPSNFSVGSVDISGIPGATGPIVPLSLTNCISYGNYKTVQETNYVGPVLTPNCETQVVESYATELYALITKSTPNYKPRCDDCQLVGSNLGFAFTGIAKGTTFYGCKGNSFAVYKDGKGNVTGSQPSSVSPGGCGDNPFAPVCTQYEKITDGRFGGTVKNPYYKIISKTYQAICSIIPASQSTTFFCGIQDPPDPFGYVISSTPYVEYKVGSFTVHYA